MTSVDLSDPRAQTAPTNAHMVGGVYPVSGLVLVAQFFDTNTQLTSRTNQILSILSICPNPVSYRFCPDNVTE